jgi:hypothetical protein
MEKSFAVTPVTSRKFNSTTVSTLTGSMDLRNILLTGGLRERDEAMRTQPVKERSPPKVRDIATHI